MVAAPATQQYLAAHPLLGLCGGAGAGRAAHHVVQVLQVLGGDRLVVVAILGEEGAQVNGGAPAQRARASPRLRLGVRMEAPKGDVPGSGGRAQASPFFLPLHATNSRSFSSKESSQGTPTGKTLSQAPARSSGWNHGLVQGTANPAVWAGPLCL